MLGLNLWSSSTSCLRGTQMGMEPEFAVSHVSVSVMVIVDA